MALNLQTFKTRALTAVIFAAVMLVGILWNGWSFIVLFTIIHFGCWYEFFRLTEQTHQTKIDNFIKIVFAICGFTLVVVLGFQNFWADIYISPFGYRLSGKWLLWIFEIMCLLIFIFQNKQVTEKAKWMSFAGLLYISLPIALFFYLRTIVPPDFSSAKIDVGKILVCAIIFSIWINDTMAYIVGSFIGKTPFSKISPKKTWEGTAGGAILCVIVIGLISWLLNYDVKTFTVIAAICAVFGTLGDLLESKLKRMANVKDSGSIMPGHGGFLDRFDSLLIAVPFVWLYVILFTG